LVDCDGARRGKPLIADQSPPRSSPTTGEMSASCLTASLTAGVSPGAEQDGAAGAAFAQDQLAVPLRCRVLVHDLLLVGISGLELADRGQVDAGHLEGGHRHEPRGSGGQRPAAG
jgi:hypothetical protein